MFEAGGVVGDAGTDFSGVVACGVPVAVVDVLVAELAGTALFASVDASAGEEGLAEGEEGLAEVGVPGVATVGSSESELDSVGRGKADLTQVEVGVPIGEAGAPPALAIAAAIAKRSMLVEGVKVPGEEESLPSGDVTGDLGEVGPEVEINDVLIDSPDPARDKVAPLI